MRLSIWATAFLVLAGATVVGAAGAAALDASHEQTRDTLNGTAGADTPDVLNMGEDVQVSLTTVLPWMLGLVSVPMGIAGILGLFSLAESNQSSTGRRRR